MARTADVLVVGGGVIGLATAMRLARDRLRVAVLDRGAAGEGRASPAAAGMLGFPFGGPEEPPLLQLCLHSRRLFPRLAEQLRELAELDVEYLSWGALRLFTDEVSRSGWEKSADHLRGLGLRAEFLDREVLRRLEPALRAWPGGALHLPDDHHVNSEELHRALWRACECLDVELAPGCEAVRLLRRGDRILGVESTEGLFTAAETLVAAGCWSGRLLEGIGLPLPVRPVRGQMLALGRSAGLRHVFYLDRGYAVPRLSGELLLGSTLEDAGFVAANTLAGVSALCRLARELSSRLAEAPLLRPWAGLRPGTPDGLPVLGRLRGLEGLLVATGHYTHGILLTPLTARVMAELVLQGTASVDLRPFSGDRFSRE